MRQQSPLSSIIVRLNSRIDYKREPVLEIVSDFANKFADFFDMYVFSCSALILAFVDCFNQKVY